MGVVNLKEVFAPTSWRIWDWKATSGCANQRFVVHSLGLCWICYSQLSSLLLEFLPTAQSLCWSFTAHSSAHKSRFHLPCDGVFSKKSVFLERWDLSTCYPVESRGGTSSKKNNRQIFLSEDPSMCCPVESGRGTLSPKYKVRTLQSLFMF